MRQYVEQKARVGDAVLLFRMGDFYETFYDDAVLCSKVLGIALTTRDRNSPNPVPLAGIPHHALESYLKKLVAAGHRVAISEQLENPKQAKGVVKRDVVRIVTAGTLTDDALLPGSEDCVLAAICLRGDDTGLALVELASGRFEVVDLTRDTLLDELVRAAPAELLIDDDRQGDAAKLGEQLRHACDTMLSRRPAHEFAASTAERVLLDHLGVATLAGFGFEESGAGVCAAGVLVQYLRETQRTALTHITALRRRGSNDALQIDHATWRSLEIDRTLRSGSREGTLLHAIDRTVHPAGTRRLRHWLRAPLIDADAIVARQDAVAFLLDQNLVRRRLRERLRQMSDVERIASRVALRRASPRDLAALGRTLRTLPSLAEPLTDSRVALLAAIAADLTGLGDLAEYLAGAVLDDPPPHAREGGYIADGFDAELDRLRSIGRDGQSWLTDFQRREVQRTGIPQLKVGFNRVFGYYIEVSHAARAEVPAEYIRKQTIKNAERYITEELKNHEQEVLTAAERAVEREAILFEQVIARVAERMQPLLALADALGRLDVLAGMAEFASQRRCVQPEIVEGNTLDIRDGRHPVLDQTLGDAFVPNDTLLADPDARLFVITGPNMAGKSTYIRQVALLTLLAQIGAFVPARSMRFSLADRLFARVGASDEIMRGQSTFMVEMTEAANILHHATSRSLVVLDELGRGTSTFDGLALAWAITEHLANAVRCRCLIATHYHEMTELAELLSGVKNYNVAVRELPAERGRESGIVFLHRIVEGGASQSYGLHVARLAGIPREVVSRGREVLDELQRGFERESRTPQLSRGRSREDDQMMLFRDPAEELARELDAVDPDRITPLEALRRIQEWKERLRRPSSQ
ncbi:MAG: DNA mismatch repair protein MutS [Phycisphaerae bacterium]|nr:DNA mismatch repair protein MutS [Phycisphaerae bacterium]